MSETVDKLGGHDVAAWLRRHPGFLKQFPDLALTLVVPRDDGPTSSRWPPTRSGRCCSR